jgi:hypothetical protein
MEENKEKTTELLEQIRKDLEKEEEIVWKMISESRQKGWGDKLGEDLEQERIRKGKAKE